MHTGPGQVMVGVSDGRYGAGTGAPHTRARETRPGSTSARGRPRGLKCADVHSPRPCTLECCILAIRLHTADKPSCSPVRTALLGESTYLRWRWQKRASCVHAKHASRKIRLPRAPVLERAPTGEKHHVSSVSVCCSDVERARGRMCWWASSSRGSAFEDKSADACVGQFTSCTARAHAREEAGVDQRSL